MTLFEALTATVVGSDRAPCGRACGARSAGTVFCRRTSTETAPGRKTASPPRPFALPRRIVPPTPPPP